MHALLYLIKLIHSTVSICLVYTKDNNKLLKILDYIKDFGINIVYVGWLIYGNILYFTILKNSSCQKNDVVFTCHLILIIVGYCQMIYLIYLVFKSLNNLLTRQKSKKVYEETFEMR